jgi:hypothetical protein
MSEPGNHELRHREFVGLCVGNAGTVGADGVLTAAALHDVSAGSDALALRRPYLEPVLRERGLQ